MGPHADRQRLAHRVDLDTLTRHVEIGPRAHGLWALAVHPQPLLLHAVTTVVFVVIAVWEWGSFHGGWVERWARLRTAKRKTP